MFSFILALVSAFFFLQAALQADAALFVIKPAANSTCQAGQKCTIDWLDDGSEPLVSAMGICTLGLYHGKQQLVQTLPAVDVSKRHSVTFVPKAAAGPSSDTYYIAIISTSGKDKKGIPYAAFSPFFRIDGMTGSFDNPLPEATSTKPFPSSLVQPGGQSSSVLSTITVGTLSTSLPPLPTPTAPSLSSSPSSQVQTSLSTKMTTSITTSSAGTTTNGPPPPSSTNTPLSGALSNAPVSALFLLGLAPLLSLLS